MELTEKRIKETLFEIKNNKLNNQKNDQNSNLLINNKEKIDDEKINLNLEKNENKIKLNKKAKEKEYSNEKNWINQSLKDIESTIFTSLDYFNE